MATLTFDYRQSIAVLGPLGTTSEPHSWDLCEFHATRMTAPRGWEMLRNLPAYSAASVGNAALDDDLWRLLAEEPRLMPHLHLSLQHGADLILKAKHGTPHPTFTHMYVFAAYISTKD